MASFLATPASLLPPKCRSSAFLETPKSISVIRLKRMAQKPPLRCLAHFPQVLIYSRSRTSIRAFEEATETNAASETTSETNSDDETDGATSTVNGEEPSSSAVLTALQSYKEALVSGEESTLAKIETFLQSIEDEKNTLEVKVAALTEELTVEKDRVLRISADFDNFRKRTEKEKLSLMSNVQGEVVESLLPVLDNFERAKAQIKVETEGEEKVNNSYQSIYKQFNEILDSLGVETVETVGITFDPMLHEAIMREDSEEYEEGVILQEFRKGFKIGDRLLRPSMVKVSAGPGPAKTEEEGSQVISEEEKSTA